MKIGENIKTARKKAGLTQEDLATILGVNKQAIFKYENGIIKNIPWDKLEIMAKALNVSIPYLIGCSDIEINTNLRYYLELITKLSDRDQDIVFHLIEFLSKQQQ